MDTPQSDPPPHPALTGLVLSFNGERLLDRCLASLEFCREILVVDCGSTDKTLDIAVRAGAVILHRDWTGFADQFTFAAGRVNTPWFFILDQDEICPPALAMAIRKAVDANAAEAFSVDRSSWYFDRFMKHGGWSPDRILRIFRTGRVEFWQDAHIHYRPLGPRAHIDAPGARIIHYPYSDFAHQLSKLNAYADQGAAALRARGKKGGVLAGVGHGLARFFRLYVLKRGFLDGRAGFIAAAHGSFYAFLKYVRVPESSWGKPFRNE